MRIQQHLDADKGACHIDQVERCAQAVAMQRRAEDTIAQLVRYFQSTEGQQRLQRAMTAQPRTPAYTSSGMITRSYSREEQVRAFIAQNQANLRRDNERMAELRRQVQWERSGYR